MRCGGSLSIALFASSWASLCVQAAPAADKREGGRTILPTGGVGLESPACATMMSAVHVCAHHRVMAHVKRHVHMPATEYG
ncbi:hypothetical protein COO60DRAFT_846083 [Scenedesmus sp. NREL 46B-D3]|nr:hypothetical protein COO60DRAFT_846083 [Scenedesmus sp. NREL 46B-D3]